MGKSLERKQKEKSSSRSDLLSQKLNSNELLVHVQTFTDSSSVLQFFLSTLLLSNPLCNWLLFYFVFSLPFFLFVHLPPPPPPPNSTIQLLSDRLWSCSCSAVAALQFGCSFTNLIPKTLRRKTEKEGNQKKSQYKLPDRRRLNLQCWKMKKKKQEAKQKHWQKRNGTVNAQKLGKLPRKKERKQSNTDDDDKVSLFFWQFKILISLINSAAAAKSGGKTSVALFGQHLN